MKKLLFFLLLALYLSSGCKQIAMWKYGIKNPKTETRESILSYARKQGQNPDNIYLFRDSVAFTRFMKDSLFKKAYFSAIVFDEKGFLVNYKDTGSCQWSAASCVGKLNKDTSYTTDQSRHFNSVISSLIPLSLQRDDPETPAAYDYTVVFTWAKYIGKLNERLFRINDAARNNPRARIRVISLNVDMQKSWGLRKDQQCKLN